MPPTFPTQLQRTPLVVRPPGGRPQVVRPYGLRDSVELVEADLALLQALAAGMSIAAIADALGCTDRTIRNRRHRLVRKLRDLSMAG